MTINEQKHFNDMDINPIEGRSDFYKQKNLEAKTESIDILNKNSKTVEIERDFNNWYNKLYKEYWNNPKYEKFFETTKIDGNSIIIGNKKFKLLDWNKTRIGSAQYEFKYNHWKNKWRGSYMYKVPWNFKTLKDLSEAEAFINLFPWDSSEEKEMNVLSLLNPKIWSLGVATLVLTWPDHDSHMYSWYISSMDSLSLLRPENMENEWCEILAFEETINQ